MSTITQNIVVGIFEDSERAHEALNELRLAGFSETELGVITSFLDASPDTEPQPVSMSTEEKVKIEHDAAKGALYGAGVGSLGALTLAALMIPGFIPLMVGGFLAMLAAGAAGGALVGGLAGGLVGLGLPERHARDIEQALLAGCTVVHVHSDARQEEAAAILDRLGAQHIVVPTDVEDGTPVSGDRTSTNESTPAEHVDFRPEHLHERETSLPAGGFTTTGGFGNMAHVHDGQKHFHLPGAHTPKEA